MPDDYVTFIACESYPIALHAYVLIQRRRRHRAMQLARSKVSMTNDGLRSAFIHNFATVTTHVIRNERLVSYNCLSDSAKLFWSINVVNNNSKKISNCCRVTAYWVRPKLHYTDTGYEHQQRTTKSPPTDKNLPHPNILTCRDVGGWHCDVANLL